MNVKEWDDAGLWHQRARYVRTLDGDTIVVLADKGESHFSEMHIRLSDYSAAEDETPEGKVLAANVRELFASDRYTGAMLEQRYWPLRVVTKKRINGNEIRNRERWIGDIFLVAEDGEMTNLVDLLTKDALTVT